MCDGVCDGVGVGREMATLFQVSPLACSSGTLLCSGEDTWAMASLGPPHPGPLCPGSRQGPLQGGHMPFLPTPSDRCLLHSSHPAQTWRPSGGLRVLGHRRAGARARPRGWRRATVCPQALRPPEAEAARAEQGGVCSPLTSGPRASWGGWAPRRAEAVTGVVGGSPLPPLLSSSCINASVLAPKPRFLSNSSRPCLLG